MTFMARTGGSDSGKIIGSVTTITGNITAMSAISPSTSLDCRVVKWRSPPYTPYVYYNNTSHQIFRIDATTGAQSLFAGSLTGLPGYANGTSTAAKFNLPGMMEVDISRDVLYVCDNGNSTIRAVNLQNQAVTTYAGSGVAGYVDGPGASAKFYGTQFLALDQTTHIMYTTDNGNYRVRKIAADGTVSTIAGSGTSAVTDGTGTAASFKSPLACALDKTNNILYVGDYAQVRKIDLSTNYVSTISGTGVRGFKDGDSTIAQFWGFEGMYYDSTSDCLYVLDYVSKRIRVVQCSTGAVSTFAGQSNPNAHVAGYAGIDPVQFQHMSGSIQIFYEGLNNTKKTMWFISSAGYYSNRIIKIRMNDKAVIFPFLKGTFGSSGWTIGQGGLTTNPIYFPNGICCDTTNQVIYFGDSGNSLIRKLSLIETSYNPTLTTAAGNTSQGFPAVDGTIANAGTGTARLGGVPGLITNAAGTLIYFVDANNWKIRKVDVSACTVSTIAGSGSVGSPYVDGNGTAATFNNPWGIALDETNQYLYVTEPTAHTIRRISLVSPYTVSTFAGLNMTSGSTDSTLASSRFNTPYGIVYKNGNIYVADQGNYKIRKINLSTSTVSTLAGSGTSFITDGLGTAAMFKAPRGLAWDPFRSCLMCLDNHRIRRVDVPNGYVTTVINNTDVQNDYYGGNSYANGFIDGVETAAKFDGNNLCVSANGTIFVADYNNHAVRRVYLKTTTGDIAR